MKNLQPTSEQIQAVQPPQTGERIETRIVDIRVDTSLQCRIQTTKQVIDEYAAALERGDIFPPVDVVRDPVENTLRLVDGFHRKSAYEQLGRKTIPARIMTVDQIGAVKLAAAANSTHGLPRSNADKRNGITKLLLQPTLVMWSDRAIGQLCRVDHKTVAEVREVLEQCGAIEPVQKRINKLGRFQPGSQQEKSIATINLETIAGDFPSTQLEPVNNADLKGETVSNQDHSLGGNLEHETIPNQYDENSNNPDPRAQTVNPSEQIGAIQRLKNLNNYSINIEFFWQRGDFCMEVSSLNNAIHAERHTFRGPDLDQELLNELHRILDHKARNKTSNARVVALDVVK